jgi:ABC-2 type transport system ATP-binding protein
MVEVEELSKWFGPNCAVDNVSFSVDKGAVLGFLGPNGAGKSTTMRMITGFLKPDGGTVRIGGHDIQEAPTEARLGMGYLPENAPAYGDMTVNAFLRFVGSLRGIAGGDLAAAVDRVVDTCFLHQVRHQPIDTLSKGYLHRTCFAQSIIHDPDVLILDEPTDGLDPNQKHEVRNLIKRMGEQKVIILSTHILEEVDAVCSRVIVIDNGKLVANGTPDELRRRSPHAGSVVIGLANVDYASVKGPLEGVEGVDKLVCLAEADGNCSMRALPTEKGRDGLSERLAAAIRKASWQETELHTDPGRLDEVFREITSFEGGKA